MVEMLCGDDDKKRKWLEACRSYSSVTNPIGNSLAELIDEDGIIYADIDISEMITAKQFHDIIGHYTRLDVVSLNLCRDEDQPVWYESRKKASPVSWEDLDPKLLREIQENQIAMKRELEQLADTISKAQ